MKGCIKEQKNSFNLSELRNSLENEEKELFLIEKYKNELQSQKLFKMYEIRVSLQDENILNALIDLQNKFRYEEGNENIQIKYLLPDEVGKRNTKDKKTNERNTMKNINVPQFHIIRNGNIIYAKHLRCVKDNVLQNYLWQDEIRDGEDVLEKSCYKLIN